MIPFLYRHLGGSKAGLRVARALGTFLVGMAAVETVKRAHQLLGVDPALGLLPNGVAERRPADLATAQERVENLTDRLSDALAADEPDDAPEVTALPLSALEMVCADQLTDHEAQLADEEPAGDAEG